MRYDFFFFLRLLLRKELKKKGIKMRGKPRPFYPNGNNGTNHGWRFSYLRAVKIQ